MIRSLVLDHLDVPRDADESVRRAAIEQATGLGLVESLHEVLIANLFDLPMCQREIDT